MKEVGFPISKVRKRGLVLLLLKVVREVGEYWLGLGTELLLPLLGPRP